LETLFQICLSNAIGALGLAIVAAAAGWLRFRPALVHGLWVLVLIALIAPPLIRIPMGRSPARAGTAAAPGAKAAADVGTARSGPRAPSGEIGTWSYREDGPFGKPAQRPSDQTLRLEWGEKARRLAATGKMQPPPIWAQPEPAGGLNQARPSEWPKRLATAIPSSSSLLVLAAWLGVAASWWGCMAWRIQTFRGLLRWARPAPDPVQQQARALASRLRLRSVPDVRFVPAAISPMLWGLFWRSRLLVPEGLWHRLGPDQQSALLLHELAHFRRRDHWVRLLELVVTGLYWWNPLVWWARRALRDAEERCCDGWVNSTLPGGARDYALAIIETIDYLADGPAIDPMGATALTTADRLEERLERILSGATARPLSWPGILALLGLTVVALGMRPGLSPPRYFRALDLGDLGGEWVEASRLNELGQVIGWATVERRSEPASRPTALRGHCFRTAPNRPINPATDDLNMLVGVRDEKGDSAIVRDINRSGHVLVQVNERKGPRPSDSVFRAFVIDGRRVVELDPSAGPGVAAINDDGLVAGTLPRLRPGSGQRPRPNALRTLPVSDHVGFVAAPNRPFDLARDDIGHLGGAVRPSMTGVGFRAEVKSINARAQVVGWSNTARGLAHAFRTAPGRPINPDTDDLGSLSPDGTSAAAAVNDLGQVAGEAAVDEVIARPMFQINASGEVVGMIESRRQPPVHAFRTAPGRPIDPATDDLGTLGGPDSRAMGINNRGDVVGEANITNGQARAFLFSGGRMIDLNSCVALPDGWVLQRASDINDRGQIVATAFDTRDLRQERHRGYLLTPAPDSVPLGMLILGTTVMGSGVALRLRRSWAGRRRRGSD
jgi:probable HAF family extracellular repeat protein